MSNIKVANPYAFPSKEPLLKDLTEKEKFIVRHGGMTLRDYFAAKALTGLWASHSHPQATNPIFNRGRYTYQEMAEACYKMADEMLKAR